MKLTKYQHACFTVENAGELLVIDPGTYTSDFIAPEHVVAVVVTHAHPDHFDGEQLAAIFAKNPTAILYAPLEVIDTLDSANKKAVQAGETITIGSFTLEFFGGLHHAIYASLPLAQNVGVLVNDLLYYPGDSYALPERPIDTLALPVAAPWLQFGDAIDFLLSVKPRLAFPTHDAIYSETGQNLADTMFGGFAEKNGIEYRRLTDTLEI